MGVSRSQNCVAEGGRHSESRTEASLKDRHLPKVVSPPATSPAEVVSISPENLEIANCYLACQSIGQVSSNLRLPTDKISEVLGKREVRAYIDNVFMDYGFNNRFKVRSVMDAIINKKLREMDESDMGSQKDIIEILALNHKMAMDILDRQIKLEEAQSKNHIRNQVNVQVNNENGGSKYENLIERLMKGDV